MNEVNKIMGYIYVSISLAFVIGFIVRGLIFP